MQLSIFQIFQIVSYFSIRILFFDCFFNVRIVPNFLFEFKIQMMFWRVWKKIFSFRFLIVNRFKEILNLSKVKIPLTFSSQLWYKISFYNLLTKFKNFWIKMTIKKHIKIYKMNLRLFSGKMKETWKSRMKKTSKKSRNIFRLLCK